MPYPCCCWNCGFFFCCLFSLHSTLDPSISCSGSLQHSLPIPSFLNAMKQNPFSLPVLRSFGRSYDSISPNFSKWALTTSPSVEDLIPPTNILPSFFSHFFGSTLPPLISCFSAASTFSTTSCSSNRTKPNPRGLPVSKSFMIMASATLPKVLKYSFMCALVVSLGSPPMNNLSSLSVEAFMRSPSLTSLGASPSPLVSPSRAVCSSVGSSFTSCLTSPSCATSSS